MGALLEQMRDVLLVEFAGALVSLCRVLVYLDGPLVGPLLTPMRGLALLGCRVLALVLGPADPLARAGRPLRCPFGTIMRSGRPLPGTINGILACTSFTHTATVTATLRVRNGCAHKAHPAGPRRARRAGLSASRYTS